MTAGITRAVSQFPTPRFINFLGVCKIHLEHGIRKHTATDTVII